MYENRDVDDHNCTYSRRAVCYNCRRNRVQKLSTDKNNQLSYLQLTNVNDEHMLK